MNELDSRLLALGVAAEDHFFGSSPSKPEERAFALGFLEIVIGYRQKDKEIIQAWQAGQDYGMDYEILRDEL